VPVGMLSRNANEVQHAALYSCRRAATPVDTNGQLQQSSFGDQSVKLNSVKRRGLSLRNRVRFCCSRVHFCCVSVGVVPSSSVPTEGARNCSSQPSQHTRALCSWLNMGKSKRKAEKAAKSLLGAAAAKEQVKPKSKPPKDTKADAKISQPKSSIRKPDSRAEPPWRNKEKPLLVCARGITYRYRCSSYERSIHGVLRPELYKFVTWYCKCSL
jgi:hypothetical protein